MREARRVIRRIRYRWLAPAVILTLILVFGFGEPLSWFMVHGTFNPCERLPAIKLDGNVLVMGDLHFRGSWERRFTGIREFIESNKVSYVVLAGDFFDSPGLLETLSDTHGSLRGTIEYTLRELRLDDLNVTFFYVAGSPTHDPQDLRSNLSGERYKFISAGKCLRFRVYGHEAIVLHGDVFFGGPLGFTVNYLYGEPVLERTWKDLIALERDVWVVMAHTHVPYIDHESRVANTGGWIWLPIFAPRRGCAVLFSENDVRLVTINDF